MWLLLAEDREISFGINIYDEKTGVENGILGGVFPEYQGEGYGIFQILGATRSAKNNRTVVSSNNFSMLRIYQHYGMILYKECYVLRKLYSKRDK